MAVLPVRWHLTALVLLLLVLGTGLILPLTLRVILRIPEEPHEPRDSVKAAELVPPFLFRINFTAEHFQLGYYSSLQRHMYITPQIFRNLFEIKDNLKTYIKNTGIKYWDLFQINSLFMSNFCTKNSYCSLPKANHKKIVKCCSRIPGKCMWTTRITGQCNTPGWTWTSLFIRELLKHDS